MGSRLHGNDGRRRRTHNRRRESTHPQPSFPRRRESTGRGGDGFPSARERRAATAHPQSSARIHAPTTVIPATAGIHGGAGDGFPSARERREAAGAPTIVGENPRPHNRHSRDGGNPRGGGAGDGFPSARERRAATRTHKRRAAAAHPQSSARIHAPQSSFPRRRESTGRAGDGFPSARERRAAYPQSSARIHAPTTVIPATAGIHGEGWGWVPVCTGTTRGGGRTHNRRRESTHPQPSFSRRRESTAATIVIPATAGIHGGGRRWVPVCTGTTGGDGAPTIVGENPRPHNRHSRDGGNPRWGPAMGSRLHGNDGRRRAHPQSSARIHGPTIVIPATAGIHGGGAAMGSRLHGNDGRRRTHNRHSREGGNPRGGRRWVPVCTGTTGGGSVPTIVGENPRTHNRHSRDGGNPRGGPAMGSRLHRNDGRRRAHPQTTGGGGAPTNDGRRRRTHNRRRESTAPQSSFPRRRESTGGAGDGFPSARERREAAGAPTIVGENPRPHNRHSRDGGNPRRGWRWVPVCTGTTGGGGRTHKRHSREWSNARVSLYGNDGARPCGSWSCTRAGRRPSPSRSRRRCCASGLWRSRPPARTRA